MEESPAYYMQVTRKNTCMDESGKPSETGEPWLLKSHSATRTCDRRTRCLPKAVFETGGGRPEAGEELIHSGLRSPVSGLSFVSRSDRIRPFRTFAV